MFYVSSCDEEKSTCWRDTKIYNKIGIADTKDGVVEFFNNAQVVNFVHEKKIKVYGVYCYGRDSRTMYAFCTPLQYGKSLDRSELNKLIDNHRKQHNPWSEYPIRDYLAMANVGTKINIAYSVSGNYDDPHTYRGKASIEKIETDLWHYEDTMNTFSGDNFDSSKAAWVIDNCCCCARDYQLSIR